MEIDREEEEDLFNDIFELFAKDLPDDFAVDMVQEKRPIKNAVEKVPSGAFYRNISELRKILDTRIPSPDSDLFFPWTVVRKGLHACHAYISWDQILIRPYIAPTLTHPPFANANQRLYMSATLGSGGELERITGVEKIGRIPTPKIYLSHGIGRRLFLFPDFASVLGGTTGSRRSSERAHQDSNCAGRWPLHKERHRLCGSHHGKSPAHELLYTN